MTAPSRPPGRKAKHAAPLPTAEQVADFIRESQGRVGHREIARAFGLKGGGAKMAVKALLKDLAVSGRIVKSRGRRFVGRGALPPVDVVEITAVDSDGDQFAKPVNWAFDAPPPAIVIVPAKARGLTLGIGDRVLAKLIPAGDDAYEARPIKKIAAAASRVLGVLEIAAGVGRLKPADRRFRFDVVIAAADWGDAQSGDLVAVEIIATPRHGPQRARVVERIGKLGRVGSLSLIAVHAHGIPHEFSNDALAQAKRAGPATLDGREDLRAVPLVTIDGADARDFDDAVWAEPDPDPGNPGGWRLIVAIADVAWYVRPGDALDRDAYERGNSVYFPDRVVPMLPEELSNGWCSLKPNEDRPCLAAHLWIDADGRLKRHRFVRGLMRSAARLTYDQAQALRDGLPGEHGPEFAARVIAPLYGAFGALKSARHKRGTLDLDLIERQIMVDREGHITGVKPRPRFDSHRLIEEFMITANVAAAETLEPTAYPCVYRVHEPPDPERVHNLGEALATLDLKIPHGGLAKPADFNRVLDKVRGGPHEHLVNMLVLRCQSQAVYSHVNKGHFGLALRRYAHFTSPIRRYSDLLVHRALIAACRLDGGGGWDPRRDPDLDAITGHISMTERRAAAAERETVDRFTAAFLSSKIDAVFPGRVNGVSRFGAFVTLNDSGADGILPHRHLPHDFYDFDEKGHRLVGRRHGLVLRVGDPVLVRLLETDEITGSIVYEFAGTADHAGSRKVETPGRSDGIDKRRAARKDWRKRRR
ncbi:MAG: ribonuclease R [Rhodospirillaceae bacterium]|nr:ribonuclease R [Rhodospirillaceae bacterium]